MFLCNQCPRRCNAPRTETEGAGHCAMPALPVVARAALHLWEEPCISGEMGSGAVFFSGCPLNCVFCQNEEISHQNFGKAVSEEQLSQIFLDLVRQGAHNINLVNPTHFAHVVSNVLCKPLPVPVVWNSGGYDSVETIKGLADKVQIWLPDLKYLTPQRAERYSGAADYPAVAAAAILAMYEAAGPVVLENGLLKRGVIIRHLLLPGGLQEAKLVMDWVAEHFERGTVLFSLMSQYTPLGRASEHPEINRYLRPSEARSAAEYMENLGLVGYTQDPASADCHYVPSFDLTGVLDDVH
ncbi:MAG: 4Fe-4S cluster-binding domain-containing protein [Oscillospiraceae bacterium]